MRAARPHSHAARSPSFDLPPCAEPAGAAIRTARDAADAARQPAGAQQILGPHDETVPEQVHVAHHEADAHPTYRAHDDADAQPTYRAHDEADAQPVDDPDHEAFAAQADRAHRAAVGEQVHVARLQL